MNINKMRQVGCLRCIFLCLMIFCYLSIVVDDVDPRGCLSLAVRLTQQFSNTRCKCSAVWTVVNKFPTCPVCVYRRVSYHHGKGRNPLALCCGLHGWPWPLPGGYTRKEGLHKCEHGALGGQLSLHFHQ